MGEQFKEQLEGIIRQVQSYHPDPDVELLRRAFTLAQEKHGEQKRRSGELYLSHPLAVTEIIAQMRLDVASLCAGLLHDIIEDTDIKAADLERAFSPEIAFIVDGVTKLSKLACNTRQERQAESFRKMLLAMSADLRVVLVKLADRLHNMRTLKHMSDEKQRDIAQETLDIYAPLAHRLGINWIKSELEDLAFQYIYPADYKELTQLVDMKKERRERYILETIVLLKAKLREQELIAEVSGRPKHFYSIWRKMKDKNIAFDQVHDVLAFRVMTDTTTHCYEVLGMVHSLWKPVPGRFKDYIALPKRNGYQSLHTSVFGPYRERVEIQIRTYDMHEVAESGVAAHWQYKESRGRKGLSSNPKMSDDARFAWLRQMLEWQQELLDPQEFMDTVKVDLFGDEVYVLTPQGDIKILPKGANVLDFAYAVHTEVGHHCTGARVNGSMVPLRTLIETGNTIEIITSPHQRPNRDWLELAQTSRARTKIKQYIRAEERDRAREIGREALTKELKRFGLKPKKVIKSKDFEAVLEQLRCGSADELLIHLGMGRLNPEAVVRRLVPDRDPAPEAPKEGALQRVLGSLTGNRGGVGVDGIEDVMVRYARCCNPVSGDPIVGFITRGRGLSIHLESCAKATLLEPERVIDVYWKDTANKHRPVHVRVLCADMPGLLAQISQGFTDMGVNISEAHCRTNTEGGAVNTFQVMVADSKQLNRALGNIRRIKGVRSVERVTA
jgi:guanosine-3',5'-bis(diphosphate) 3'-pyrophosphohydrolase